MNDPTSSSFIGRCRRLLLVDDGRVVRFAVIGATTALIYFILYFGLRRGLDASAILASVIAYVAAISFQYFGHAIFTFKRPSKDMTQGVRFLINNALGGVISTAIMAGAPPLLGVSEAVAAAGVLVALPSFNWIMMRFWVYR